MKSLQLTVLTIAVSSLVACSGKGVDASLNLSSMEEFQKSYAIASKDMTQEQKDSFEWAVSNISLAQVSAKYSRPTVRAIVQGEADEFIKAHQKIIDKQKEIMASKHDLLTQNRNTQSEQLAELNKITASRPDTRNHNDLDGQTFSFKVTNGSKYNLSSVAWDVNLFIDDEEKSDRKCSMTIHFNHGLDAKSGPVNAEKYWPSCAAWKTVEVQRAKKYRFTFKVDPHWVNDFADKRIYSKDLETFELHEEKIQDSMSEIKGAERYKATVL